MSKDAQFVYLLKKIDRRIFSQITLLLCFSFFMPFISGCNSKTKPPDIENGDSGMIMVTPTNEKNRDCPQLDSKLYQLYLMDDPIPTAEELGFRVINGKVQVLLILADEDTAVPTTFDLEVGTHIGNQAQVFVTFGDLCELANTEEVIAIRQPMPPILE